MFCVPITLFKIEFIPNILKDVSNKSAINKIATKKQSLYDYIKSLETKKQFILKILNSMVVDKNELLTQLSQLDNYETEIKTIQLNINESSDMSDLQEYEKQLVVLEKEFDIILKQVQAFEYSTKSSSTVGGKRRTRKFPKNLVIAN